MYVIGKNQREYFDLFRGLLRVFVFYFMCIFVILYFIFPTIAHAIECTNPKYWIESNNTIFLNRNRIVGAYIAKIDKIFYLGSVKVKSKHGKYLNSFLYKIEIKDKIIGNLEKDLKEFMLVGTLSNEGIDENTVNEERYTSESWGAQKKYIAFVISHGLYDLGNYNNNNIFGLDIVIPSKFWSLLRKYTDQILFVGGCSTWSVNKIYDGVQYDIIKYMKKYLSNQN